MNAAEPTPPASPSRAADLVLIGVAVIAALLALANAGFALVFPLELELREGTAWLHAIAARDGVDLYEHGRVAFVNMNHGPLDPILKHALAAVLPWLGPAAITRAFVVLLPLALLAAMWRATGGRLWPAIAWAGGLHLFLLGLSPPHFLLGRSDPTALCLLALLLWRGSKSLGRPLPARVRTCGGLVATGVIGGFVLAANWRFFPAVGAVIAGLGAEALALTPRGRRGASLVRGIVAVLCGLALPFAVIVLGQFGGDWDRYQRHFFGFFTAASGWGTTAAGQFELLPAALLATRWPLHLAALVLVVLGLCYPAARVPRALQVWVWLPLLGLLGVTCSVAYFLNHGGGGLHYYAAFYLPLAFHLARAVDWPQVRPMFARGVVGAALLLGLPWTAMLDQAGALARSRGQAEAFLAACREAAGSTPIYSEEFHFFKTRYSGETIDMGDEVHAVAETGFFGPTFSATARASFARLAERPPPFVLSGGIGSAPLQRLLAEAYVPALRVPYAPGYAGPPQTLFRHRSVPAPAPGSR